jgi:protein-S-isoprenylcysteine O-methyltransferase
MEPSTIPLHGASISQDHPDGSWSPPTNRRAPTATNGHVNNLDTPPPPPSSQQTDLSAALDSYDSQYLPGHPKSLSGIATRSFLLGSTLILSLTLALHTLLTTSSPLWRAPCFLTILSLFHFLEFWTTARYNTRAAHISSFLLSQNGSAYNIAHSAALAECLLTHLLFPHRAWLPAALRPGVLLTAAVLVGAGQFIRSAAMIAAGTNFNHIVQRRKADSHRLVTSGVYAHLRHPSYFGFFWWGLGTQLLLGNVLCFVGYAVVLWRFFAERIAKEEELLVAFFGGEYEVYRKRTRVGIPFIR